VRARRLRPILEVRDRRAKLAGIASAGAKSRAGERPPPAAAKFVAIRNYIAIEVDPGAVQKTLDEATARCQLPACEVLESSLARDARDAPPHATLRLRIAPQASAAFVDAIAREGDVIERRTQSEDKTEQVVDVEARLKNTPRAS